MTVQPNSGRTVLPLERDRRRDNRKPVPVKAALSVLDGEFAGQPFEILMRDLSDDGASFQLKVPLSVGQNLRIELLNGSKRNAYDAQVLRSRPLSSGKFEMAVSFRKAF